jgi:predicted MFS family arabinose efflux permease
MKMMQEKLDPGNKKTIISLIIAAAPLEPPGTLVSLLLLEISLAFGVSLGIAGQIQTTSSSLSTAMALLVGVLSIKFRHKTLLLLGLLTYAVSAICCSVSPSFLAITLAYSMIGLASAVVTPMITTLIGEHLSVAQRSKAIGNVNSLRAFTYLLTAPIIGYIAKAYDWRMAFLFFLLPISLISLVAAYIGIPSKVQETSEKRRYSEGLKRILSNRSAIACLLGSVMAQAAWFGILAYSASFFRQRFDISIDLASLFLSAIAGCFMVGSYLSGWIINRFGRKRVTVFGVFPLSILSFVYMVVPNLWLALLVILLAGTFSAIRFTSSISLTLEQDPDYRGTMMSLNTAALNLGRVIGSAVGGFSLLFFSWVGIGTSMGILGLIATFLYAFIAIDPITT